MIARTNARPRPPADPPAAFRVCLTETLGWRVRQAGLWRLWLKGGLDGTGENGLVRWLSALPPTLDLALAGRFLGEIRGHFALIAEGPGTLLAAVDRVRSIPIVYGCRDDVLMLDQDGGRLAAALGLEPADVDHDAALAIALAGYTVGDDTLYRTVRQLGPGEFILAGAGAQIEIGRHHRYAPYHPVPRPRSTLKRELKAVIHGSLERLIAAADGRPIVVPLSAGCDSRLVASGLKALGYPNVLTLAYGLPGNHEADTSRKVAERLGLPWRFVAFSPRLMRATFASDDYAAFRASSDSLTGVHFPQDYVALVTLRREGYVPADALIVNGQSGDFITGNHIPPTLATPRPDLDAAHRQRRVTDALIAKHFKQWRMLVTPPLLERIRAMLDREIAAIGGMPANAGSDHGVYEWCEFQDRQSKYVVNGQRLYEYLGHDWRLPLWDDSWLDFWAHVPIEAKRGQNLYREVLSELNFGGVWLGLPINVKNVRPGWMAALRPILRSVHAPFGRSRWHEFERQYLSYWMDNLCSASLRGYLAAATDRRGPRSGIAFHIEDYLRAKGLTLEGLRL